MRQRKPYSLDARRQWFAVVPDTDNGRIAIERITGQAAHIIPYSSGRPWIAGEWPDETVQVISGPAGRVAVIGQYAAQSEALRNWSARLRSTEDLDSATGSLPGSYHVVADFSGRIRIRGTISGLRRVHYCRHDGATIASDRADVLADLTGRQINERELALRLVDPVVPHPLGDNSVWRGVRTVPADHDLEIDAAGTHRELRRWRPPEPHLPLTEAAVRVRSALAGAVAARTADGGIIGCDLSGGLDSTSLCFLAAASEAKVLAYTGLSSDPADDDIQWARLAAARMPGIEHEIVPADEIAPHYSGLTEPAEPFDEPCLPIAERARLRAMLRRPCERGVRIYLAGFGGDELASGSSCHLSGLLWRRPWTAATQMCAYRAMFRWSWRASLRTITRSRSYASWFRTLTLHPAQPADPRETVLVEWGYPAALPPWMPPDAVALVRETVRAAARDAAPLAPDRSQHYHLTCLRAGARIVAQFGQIASQAGTVLAAPFYDDAVVEAFLSALPHERATPWHYKPLLTSAMRGIVPAESLARVTKGGSPVHEITGRRTHWRALSALWEDPWLARLGLVDAAQLRAAFNDSQRLDDLQGTFHRTLSAELWLRDVAARSGQ